jgi:alanine dehydrogenase
MQIGVPAEIKNHEYRVGLVPQAARELVRAGHKVSLERGAGSGAGISDEEYVAAGVQILPDAQAVYEQAELIVKVKEPQAKERIMLRKDQILFTYLHLAPDADQTRDLIKSRATCIAYETVTAENGSLPLLAPMSEVAGRLAPQVGATALQKSEGGRGVLLGGVPGVLPANVLILGGGVSGSHAASIAVGMGANVTVMDRSHNVLKRISAQFGDRVRTLFSTEAAIDEQLANADLVIGTVLVRGATAPKLITRAMLTGMRAGAVIVDVAIDQGGCCETARPTTHDNPTYIVDGIVHYCVANMPGAVARTSTYALNNATLPFTLDIANKGWLRACRENAHLCEGLNVHDGAVTSNPVADAHGLEFVSPSYIVN